MLPGFQVCLNRSFPAAASDEFDHSVKAHLDNADVVLDIAR